MTSLACTQGPSSPGEPNRGRSWAWRGDRPRRPWPPPRRARPRRWRACPWSRRAGCGCPCRGRIARPAEGLEVHLVADAVAGLGEPRPVARGGRLHVPVVVGVARVRLVDVVVDVAHHPRGLDPRKAHGLELQPRHVAVGVREQALVHAQADLLSSRRLAGHQMRVDELARDGEAHRYRCSTGTNFLPVGPL